MTASSLVKLDNAGQVIFDGHTAYIAGGPTLRYADVSVFLEMD